MVWGHWSTKEKAEKNMKQIFKLVAVRKTKFSQGITVHENSHVSILVMYNFGANIYSTNL